MRSDNESQYERRGSEVEYNAELDASADGRLWGNNKVLTKDKFWFEQPMGNKLLECTPDKTDPALQDGGKYK